MATPAETILKSIENLKAQNETARTKLESENAELRKSLETSKSETTELKKSFETTKSEFDKLNGYLMQPDHDQNSPYRIFGQVKDDKAEGRVGFKSFGHYLHDVRQAGLPTGRPSEVLKSWIDKAPSALNEGSGNDGGFLVPPAFASEIFMRAYDNSLWDKTTKHTCGSNTNSLSFNAIDETSRAAGSRFGGVQAYWDAEADQATTTKPRYNQVRLQLHKLLAITYATDELIADSGTAMEQHLFNIFGSEVKFKLGDAIVNGTGAGMPLGILNSAALVSVSKEIGQAAATIVYENLVKMYSRVHAPSRANAVWLINQDIEPALFTMALNVGTGGMPVYLPAGGASEKPYGTLFGRPVMPVEFCSTLGTVGDVIFADLSQIYSLNKGNTDMQTSAHIRFDYAEQAFRIVHRADCRPIWASAYTPFKGTATKSFAVALATRS